MGALIIGVVMCILCECGVLGGKICLVILGAAIAWAIICATLYFKLGWFRFFYHNFLGWHTPDNSIEHWSDGLSEHATCKYCKKDIMQDSQGNWFC